MNIIKLIIVCTAGSRQIYLPPKEVRFSLKMYIYISKIYKYNNEDIWSAGLIFLWLFKWIAFVYDFFLKYLNYTVNIRNVIPRYSSYDPYWTVMLTWKLTHKSHSKLNKYSVIWPRLDKNLFVFFYSYISVLTREEIWVLHLNMSSPFLTRMVVLLHPRYW